MPISDPAEYSPDDPKWIGRTDLARLFGMSVQWLDDECHKLGRQYQCKVGSRVYIYAPDWLLAWSNARRIASSNTVSVDSQCIDHTDRLKRAQADKAELELAKIRRQSITVDEVVSIYVTLAGKIREGIELVGRINPECREVMLGKIDEADRILQSDDRLGASHE